MTAVICSFSLLCSSPLYDCTDNPFYCCCLFGLDIMYIDNAAPNILVCVFQYYVHVFLLVLYLEMELLGHRVCRCSTSVDNASQFSRVVVREVSISPLLLGFSL